MTLPPLEAGNRDRGRGRLVQRSLAVLVGPITLKADDPAPELHAIADKRADGIGGLMSAELERRFEAVAAEAAAGWADIGARLDEVVVHRADAVGATDLPARPIAGLGGSGALRRGPLPARRRVLSSV